MRRLVIVASMLALLLTAAAGPAAAGPGRNEQRDHEPRDNEHRDEEREVQVLSQNLYIGADLSRLLNGEPPAALLATVQRTNFPERAVAIARLIEEEEPDLIGLQEVSHLSVIDAAGTVLLDLDYLTILLAALAAEGESYAVASAVDNADVTAPLDPAAGTVARVVDRDVILYRTGTTSVANPTSANYQTNFIADLAGFPVEFTRGYTAVDATVEGLALRFANTHLEVRGGVCPTTAGAVRCQEPQARELVAALGGTTLPVVLVGDFNAEPGTVAYETIASGGYLDTWSIGAHRAGQQGFTCCHTETLENPASGLTSRIDHVFLRPGGPGGLGDPGDPSGLEVEAEVVGDRVGDRTPSGLWPSDHAGAAVELELDAASSD